MALDTENQYPDETSKVEIAEEKDVSRDAKITDPTTATRSMLAAAALLTEDDDSNDSGSWGNGDACVVMPLPGRGSRGC